MTDTTATLTPPSAPVTSRLAAAPPVSLVAGLALGALLLSAGGLAYHLAVFWGINSNYADRFIILLADAWLFWTARGALTAPRTRWLGLLPLAVGAAAAVPVNYLSAQVGPRSILLWWLAAAWVLSAVGFVLLAGGWRWLRRLSFPLAFVFLALPIPERIEGSLQAWLQGKTTTLAEWGLRACGMTVHRQGYELHLPSGGLEVVEACSGVRSITALLAIAVFVSHLRGFGLLRGLAMLALAVPVIALVNALRIILTGLIQEGFGTEWVQGTPHEVLGTVMVLVGLGMVMLLSYVMRSRQADEPPGEPTPFPGFAAGAWAWPAAAVLVAGVALSGWAHYEGRRRVIQNEQIVPFDRLPVTISEWTGEELAIPDTVRDILTYDRAAHRVYLDKIGNRIDVFVIYWQGTTAIRGYHHPDICFPNRGYNKVRDGEQLVPLAGGQALPVTVREFERDRQQAKLCYWTQVGRHVLTREEMEGEDRSGQGHRWIRDRLVPSPPELSARVSVLIRADLWGKTERTDAILEDFTRRFADEFYDLCPWAVPESSPERAGAN